MAWSSQAHPDGRIGTPSFRAPPPHRLKTDPRCLVDHERDTRAVGVDGTQAGGEPGDAPGGVGGSVHRIDHHHHVAIAPVGARLLGHDPEPGPGEHRKGGSVGYQVRPVLTVTGSGRAPVGQGTQGFGHGRGRVMEHAEQSLVIHGATIPEPSWPR